jgi:hypothetical protein
MPIPWNSDLPGDLKKALDNQTEKNHLSTYAPSILKIFLIKRQGPFLSAAYEAEFRVLPLFRKRQGCDFLEKFWEEGSYVVWAGAFEGGVCRN